MKLFLQKKCKILSAGGFAPKPPDLHWPPAAGGSAPDPKTAPPHCEFLATRLLQISLILVIEIRHTFAVCIDSED